MVVVGTYKKAMTSSKIKTARRDDGKGCDGTDNDSWINRSGNLCRVCVSVYVYRMEDVGGRGGIDTLK